MVTRSLASGTGDAARELLGRLPLFHGLPPKALEEVVRNVRLRGFSRGTVIFHKDDPGNQLYVILKGAVSITLASEDGKDLVLSILSAGDFFGELSLIDEQPRSASAVAVDDDTQTLILPREAFLEPLMKYPQMALQITTLLSRRLREADALAQDSALLDLPGRLARRLLELGERHGRREGDRIRINLRLTQSELASLIGATRVATNRQLQRFQQQGVLSWQAQHITLLKPAVLRKLGLL
ncbi:MAG TPA: Crp/Fnr family transcriptional regulator [Dehalococcoidia bacterium]|nr:Crp/Fnr family transcriptional regulator [Dehalococcoidia bacterium]